MPQTSYELYARIEKLNGWLNKPAAYFTFDLLNWQDENKVEGGIVEIGVFCGKYFSILMESALRTGSPILGVDTFEFVSEDRVRVELAKIFEGGDVQKVMLWQMKSSTLRPGHVIDAVGDCRFLSIDGAHDYENVFRDLVLAEQILSTDGIIAVDDFLNPLTLGVNQAVNAFFAQPRSVVPVAYTANKLFLSHRASADEYRSITEKIFETGEEPFAVNFRNKKKLGRHHIEQDFYGSRVLLR